jgi:hypothetical protein
MPSLLGRLPKDSFPELLKMNNSGVGVTSTLTAVQDGTGVNSPLSLSLTQISLNGAVWPVTAGSSGQVLTYGTNGNLSWTTVSVPTNVSQLTNDANYVTSSSLTTSLGSYALKASPALTGTPTAPTATAGTNTTQLATTAFVTAAVSAGAPNLSTYAPLASPALTGTPTAPTAAVSTNTTQLATTAFVLGQASATTPTMAGTAAVGVATTFARADHTHPVDTSRAAAASPTITGRTQSDAYSYTVLPVAVVAGSPNTLTLPMGTASEFTTTFTASTTIVISGNSGTTIGQVAYLRVVNPGAGNVTWPSGTKFVGGTAPTYTVSGTDLYGIMYDATTSTYMVFVIGQNIQ